MGPFLSHVHMVILIFGGRWSLLLKKCWSLLKFFWPMWTNFWPILYIYVLSGNGLTFFILFLFIYSSFQSIVVKLLRFLPYSCSPVRGEKRIITVGGSENICPRVYRRNLFFRLVPARSGYTRKWVLGELLHFPTCIHLTLSRKMFRLTVDIECYKLIAQDVGGRMMCHENESRKKLMGTADELDNVKWNHRYIFKKAR